MRLPVIDDVAPSGRAVALIVAVLIGLRMICAALTPLAFDEAYYWTWSRHLAPGYYDHPPMVAMIVRLGTMIGGDTHLGVRLVAILLAAPLSYAVYRAADILFPGRRIAADAVLLLNATLMVAAGTVIVTPDAPLVAASAFVLLTLAKVVETGRGVWWIAAGAAVGAALLSKYTAFFFGPAILIWLLAVPSQRRWLVTPWPYLGGLVAFALFAPVIWWNAEHQWLSFLKQFGRARVGDGLTLRFVAEMAAAQFALATPLVFVLGMLGLYLLAMRKAGARTSRVLVSSLVWTIAGYFVWHALHSRVEANWLSPVYPAFAIAAAVAANHQGWPERWRRMTDFCRRWALPASATLLMVFAVHVNTGLLTANRRDNSARLLGVGFSELAKQVEAARQTAGARCVAANDYPTYSWLAFYLPRSTCIFVRAERYRWADAPDLDPADLTSRLLFIDDAPPGGVSVFRAHPAFLDTIGQVARRRGGLIVDTFQLDVLDGTKQPIIDPTPPPELRR